MYKPKYTEDLASRIVQLAEAKKTNGEIADALGIGKATLSRYISDHEKLKVAIARRDHPEDFRNSDIREGILNWLLEDIKSRGETTEIIEKDKESGFTRKTKIGTRVPAHYLEYLYKLQEEDEDRDFTVRLELAIPDESD